MAIIWFKSGMKLRGAMCITRVGKVISTSGGMAEVEFFDKKALAKVDVSMVTGVGKGTYLEVYGNLALSALSPAEANKRKSAWKEIRKAALLPSKGDDLT